MGHIPPRLINQAQTVKDMGDPHAGADGSDKAAVALGWNFIKGQPHGSSEHAEHVGVDTPTGLLGAEKMLGAPQARWEGSCGE
ncbi:hypothetical protein AAFF_G00224010 [Aldrovandia affinis]|uniref:Uncharacterized protein n=1 Tax=Aldrovandia affinis TaxID=143900 RepID=A0AAD7TC11_9TELE|nr:hypothetical protein AAFF_G00224010 [Aldrovandia affinis]